MSIAVFQISLISTAAASLKPHPSRSPAAPTSNQPEAFRDLSTDNPLKRRAENPANETWAHCTISMRKCLAELSSLRCLDAIASYY